MKDIVIKKEDIMKVLGEEDGNRVIGLLEECRAVGGDEVVVEDILKCYSHNTDC